MFLQILLTKYGEIPDEEIKDDLSFTILAKMYFQKKIFFFLNYFILRYSYLRYDGHTKAQILLCVL